MAIQDRNEIVFMPYDSVVEYEKADYSMAVRYNYSHPVMSFLLFELRGKGGTRYLWYDKQDHSMAILSQCAEKDIDKAALAARVSDNFHVQIERREGAPQLFPTRLEVLSCADGSCFAVCDSRAQGSIFLRGCAVSPAHLTIYPYGE